MDNWNGGLETARSLVAQQNDEIRAKHQRGEISAKTLAQTLSPMPSEVEKPNQKWCRNFVKNFGWSLLSPSMEQASLPFDHPDMKLYRDNYKKMITTGQVHPYLVLNFDQVWRCAFSWSGLMHWKPRENVGKRSKKVKTPKTLDKKRHAVRGARKSVTAPRFNQHTFVYMTVQSPGSMLNT